MPLGRIDNPLGKEDEDFSFQSDDQSQGLQSGHFLTESGAKFCRLDSSGIFITIRKIHIVGFDSLPGRATLPVLEGVVDFMRSHGHWRIEIP